MAKFEGAAGTYVAAVSRASERCSSLFLYTDSMYTIHESAGQLLLLLLPQPIEQVFIEHSTPATVYTDFSGTQLGTSLHQIVLYSI